MARMGWREFWPYYLGEHKDPRNRAMHVTGTSLAFLLIVAAVVTQIGWLLLGAAVAGYAFAWIGHFVLERNRPATFTYPIKSLAYDWRMWALTLTGRIGREYERQGLL
jgi:hypothetical protein